MGRVCALELLRWAACMFFKKIGERLRGRKETGGNKTGKKKILKRNLGWHKI